MRGARFWLDTSVFTVLVFAATAVIAVYQPFTGGYVNLGESMIYLAALISGPLVAGLAGGVGAALADLALGYAIFAPGTLVIKMAEGIVVGHLARRGGMAPVAAAIYAALFLSISYLSWGSSHTISVVSLILAPAVAAAVLLASRREGWDRLPSLLVGGLVMVLGYFLYEFFLSNPLQGRPRIGALWEVPGNMIQVLVGAAIAVPVYAFLKRAGYVRD
ncbi:MAG TPA: hypothetical protein ENF35_01395 [Aciduliprofundum sp.]|nr:hypothetical protein [Aciduliprofundum sp.]